jgi:hypothetical protein
VKPAIALISVAALVWAAVAAADAFDPKVKLTRADQAAASASILRFNDLGSAWSGGAVKPQSLKVPLCPGVQPNYSKLTITGHAESTLELANQGLQVDSDVEILKSAKQAQSMAAKILKPALPGCLKYDLLRSGLASGPTTIGKVSQIPVVKVGNRIALYRVTLTVHSGGKKVGVLSDYLYLTKDRTEFFVNLIGPANVSGELPAFENHIAKTLASRGR